MKNQVHEILQCFTFFLSSLLATENFENHFYFEICISLFG
jgi:hypothetical protein